MTPLTRVLFLGQSCAAAMPPLAALIEAGVEIPAVVLARQPGARLGEIQRVASTAGIPVVWVRSAAEATDAIRAAAPEVAVAACFPWRLPHAALEIPPLGILNVHPSLLPAGRGPEPVFWTLRRGEPVTGVTIHRMDAGFDTGPIVAQAEMAVPEGVRAPDLERALMTRGGSLLVDALLELAAGTLQPQPQPSQGVTYAPVPSPADWTMMSSLPAAWAWHFARGVAPLGGPLTAIAGGTAIRVVDALDWSPDEKLPERVIDDGDGTVRVRFSPGWVRFRRRRYGMTVPCKRVSASPGAKVTRPLQRSVQGAERLEVSTKVRAHLEMRETDDDTPLRYLILPSGRYRSADRAGPGRRYHHAGARRRGQRGRRAGHALHHLARSGHAAHPPAGDPSPTSKPFAVNLVLDWDPAERLAIALHEGVRIVSFFWGDPAPWVEQVHAAGGIVLHTVASAEEARRAADAGVDAVVAQGWEAGGHVWGQVSTLALVPRVVDAVAPLPVVAAGGIADGRGLAAVLALGAGAAWMGTRFLLAEEAATHPVYQETRDRRHRNRHRLQRGSSSRLAQCAASHTPQRDVGGMATRPASHRPAPAPARARSWPSARTAALSSATATTLP